MYPFRTLYSCSLSIWNCHFFQGRSRINCRWTKIIHAKYCLEMVKCILAAGTKNGSCGVFKPCVTCLFKDWQRTITYLDDDILILRDDGDPLVSLEGCAFCGFSVQLLRSDEPSEAVYRISTWSARFTCDLRETPQSRLSERAVLAVGHMITVCQYVVVSATFLKAASLEKLFRLAGNIASGEHWIGFNKYVVAFSVMNRWDSLMLYESNVWSRYLFGYSPGFVTMVYPFLPRIQAMESSITFPRQEDLVFWCMMWSC